MDIENLKGLPILKARFKQLANTNKTACADLNLPDNTVGIVYWKEEDSWVVHNYYLEDSLRAIKSETKDRGYKIDALYFADKFEAKNYNGGIGKLLHVALEAYANPENKTGNEIEGKYVVELDINDDPVYFLMDNNAWQDELTKEEFSTLWDYTCDTIIIPAGTTVIEKRAFADKLDLTNIVIPDSVTEIGDNAFSGCTGLTGIVIPGSVTKIGRNAFSYCTGLTSIVISGSVTEIGDSAFYNCTGLTSIVVSEDNKVYDSRENCNAIIKTESNTLIVGCSTTIIPNSVMEIGGKAFVNCKGLTSIEIPNSVTKIGWYVFNGCSGLTSIVIPDTVTEIGTNAFFECTGLTDIVVPQSVKTIEWGAFGKCTSLASVTIEGPIEKIEESAFDGCTGLKTLTLPAGIKKISKKAFEGCTAIERINVPAKKTDYYKKRLPENLHAFIVEQ